MIKDQVFVSYSSKDYKWLEQLEKHLSSQKVCLWADVNVEPGEDWYQRVKSEIENSKFAIVLISPDYLASRMINNELQIIFQRVKEGKLQILPVIASSFGDKSFNAEVGQVFEGYPPVSNNSLAADDSESIYQIISDRISPPSKSGDKISNFIDWFKTIKSVKEDRSTEDVTRNKCSDLQKNIFFEIEEKLAQQEQEKLTQQHD